MVYNLKLGTIKNFFSEIGSPFDGPAQNGAGNANFSNLLRDESIFEVISVSLSTKSVLEFGTWFGQSAITWAHWTPEECEVVCVDTWLGSWEHYVNVDSRSEWSRNSLKLENGRPSFFQIL